MSAVALCWHPRVRASAAAPWWPPPGPSFGCHALVASTAPLMRSTGPRLGCRALLGSTAPELRLPRPGASTGPRIAPRPVRRFRASAAGALVPSTGPRFAPRPGGWHRARGSRRVCRCAQGVCRVVAPALRLSWSHTGALSTGPKNRLRCPLAPSTGPRFAPYLLPRRWRPPPRPRLFCRVAGGTAVPWCAPPAPDSRRAVFAAAPLMPATRARASAAVLLPLFTVAKAHALPSWARARLASTAP